MIEARSIRRMIPIYGEVGHGHICYGILACEVSCTYKGLEYYIVLSPEVSLLVHRAASLPCFATAKHMNMAKTVRSGEMYRFVRESGTSRG